MQPVNLIGGQTFPLQDGPLLVTDPAEPGVTRFSATPDLGHVDRAVAAARAALGPWSGLPRQRRFDVLHRFAAIARAEALSMAERISMETGKAMWEARAEAALLPGKVEITLDPGPHGGLARVSDSTLPLSPTRDGHCRYKPHGVMAVVGPYNFPAHLPNGHIVPALAMGNTVVFKPSDKAPGTGQLLASWFVRAVAEELGPAGAARVGGVVNLVHGDGAVAARLCGHDDIDGILFTGSWPVARQIAAANLDRPGRLLAFELGGNNPAVVMPSADLGLAALEVARSAFVTTGQRCTCTRRLIVHEDVAEKVVALVRRIAQHLVIGHPRRDGPVFCGPIISRAARQAVLDHQAEAVAAGAALVLEARAVGEQGHYLSPGILRVERFSADPAHDVEVFGPLLKVVTISSPDEAVRQANATRYGLAASIFTADPAEAERFVAECRAGCINVNTGTAGASSKLPFGGLGLSGNHRPAGSVALDYCAVPVASMVERSSALPALSEGMRFDPAWTA